MRALPYSAGPDPSYSRFEWWCWFASQSLPWSDLSVKSFWITDELYTKFSVLKISRGRRQALRTLNEEHFPPSAMKMLMIIHTYYCVYISIFIFFCTKTLSISYLKNALHWSNYSKLADHNFRERSLKQILCFTSCKNDKFSVLRGYADIVKGTWLTGNTVREVLWITGGCCGSDHPLRDKPEHESTTSRVFSCPDWNWLFSITDHPSSYQYQYIRITFQVEFLQKQMWVHVMVL